MFDVNTSRLSYDLRSSGMNLIVPKARTNCFRNSFASAGAKLWNSLPSSLKEETSLKQFKANIRILYLNPWQVVAKSRLWHMLSILEFKQVLCLRPNVVVSIRAGVMTRQIS
ncbi:unnamed protein product, partial [Porites lobata]